MVVQVGCPGHEIAHNIRNHRFGDCPVADVRIRCAVSCMLAESQPTAAPLAAPRPAQELKGS
eukprot:13715025-Alexandrium_andersonii.AAC.1